MIQPFLLSLRESLQCSLLLLIIFLYPQIRDNRHVKMALFTGVISACFTGFISGYLPVLSNSLPGHEAWAFWRHASDSMILYISILFIYYSPRSMHFVESAATFILGFSLLFYEARAVGFLLQDITAMHPEISGILPSAIAGLCAGAIPLLLLKRIPVQKDFTLPSLFMVVGSLRFGLSGVSELEKDPILIPLKRGLMNFLGEAVQYTQSLLLIQGHSFLKSPLADLADFIAGDRIAMTIALLFMMAPPLVMLSHIFARPDPALGPVRSASQRRSSVAFFRAEIIHQTFPVMTSFLILVFLLHAANFSMNPLYDPVPAPVQTDEGSGMIRLPLSDRTGNLNDKKLRKYVYYHGNRQIIFLAVVKTDGSVGLALDECEICRPADWNVDARGYAQRGENLVCKYCVTPIATATVNNPGGCNPVPVPFHLDDTAILIKPAVLIDTYEKLQAMEKKGTHL